MLNRELPAARRRFGRVGLAVAVGCAALVTAGCGSSSSSHSATSTSAGSSASAATTSKAGSVTLGFSPFNQSSPALVGLGKGVQGYAKSFGAKVLVANPDNNSTTQVQQLEQWIDLGQVKAIWAMALDPTTMRPVLAAAQAHHVGLLSTGTPADYGKSAPSAGLAYSIINYDEFGGEIGKDLGMCINQRLGGKGQVLYVSNPAGSTGKPDEDAAFAKALKQVSPHSSVVATTASANDRLTAQQNALSAIQGHPGINAVAGVTDEGSLGALAALQLSHKSPTSNACAVGAGGSAEALADVKKKLEYAYVVINFKGDLQQNVRTLVKFAKDPTAVGTQLYTPFSTYSSYIK